MIQYHAMIFLFIPTFMLIGHFYQKQKDLAENLKKIVERKTSQLRESETKLRNIFAASLDAIILMNDQGEISFWNRAAERIFGYSKEEVIGKKVHELLAPKRFLEEFEKFKKTEQGIILGRTFESAAIRKDGKEFPIELSLSTLQLKGKWHALGIVRDITERKKMQKKLAAYSEQLKKQLEKRTKELKKAQEQLLNAERLSAIGEVAAMVGHDLRNPLQSIENATYHLQTELLRLSPSATSSQKLMEMFKVIHDSVNHADKIIRDLQDFSTTKKPLLTMTNVNVIVTEALSQLRAPENIEVVTELGDLPEIKVDRDMIKRVFLNLAINGIQAIQNEGRLKISTKKIKDFVEVSFEDNGVGISREHLNKLFTPFFTTKAKGMGLGLAICKKFVESHGGNIQIRSKRGKGTTFTVKLPINGIE